MTSQISNSADIITVCALYKFVTLSNYVDFRDQVHMQLIDNNIKGTILLANEGINGTISGSSSDIDSVLDWLRSDQRLQDIDCKLSFHSKQPFHRTKVKLKKEIVTMGVQGIDPNKVVGTYVEAADWNALISDPETLLIDTRNEYEYGIGSFKQAINPHTETFRQFPDYVEKNLDPSKHKKVAMFCTGGIRCEKASAFMKAQGFDEVYHLKGGVLKYLEKVPENESLWQGECFVFDDRVAVNQNLDKGQYDQCHACRYPITDQQKQSEHYIPGVSCPRCYDTLSQQQKDRFSERERQVQLAKARGEEHIGSDSRVAADQHRLEKQTEKDLQRANLKTQSE
ncbi:MAG: UPF0176 protein [Cryomorphaceae bacterium]|jgi:UPF0176 protein